MTRMIHVFEADDYKFIEERMEKLPLELIEQIIEEKPSLVDKVDKFFKSTENGFEKQHLDLFPKLFNLERTIKTGQENGIEFASRDRSFDHQGDQLRKIMIRATDCIAYFSSKQNIPMMLRHYIVRCRAGLLFLKLFKAGHKKITRSFQIDYLCIMHLLGRTRPQEICGRIRITLLLIIREVERSSHESHILEMEVMNLFDSGYSSKNTSSLSSNDDIMDGQIRICESPTRGRYMRLHENRLLEAKEEVFTEEPIVHLLSSHNSYSRCYQCIQHIQATFVKCPNMCPVVFCSKSCYHEAVEAHKSECPVMHQLFPLRSSVQMFLRSFLQDQGRSLEALTHHYSKSSVVERRIAFADALRIRSILVQIGRKPPNLSFIVETIFKICLNNIALKTESKKHCGSALYRFFSMICHSCSPNTDARHFRGKTLYIRASRTIHPNEELTICYSYFNLNTKDRREKLKKDYHFECWCEKCFDEVVKSQDLSFHRLKQVCTSCPNSPVVLKNIESIHTGQYSTDIGSGIPSLSRTTTERAACPSGCPSVNLSFFQSILRNSKHSRSLLLPLEEAHNQLLTLFVNPDPLTLCFEDSRSYFYLKILESAKSPKSRSIAMKRCLLFSGRALVLSIRLLGYHRLTAFCLVRFLLLIMKNYHLDQESNYQILPAIPLFASFPFSKLISFAMIEMGITINTRFCDIELWLKEQQPIYLNCRPSSLKDLNA